MRGLLFAVTKWCLTFCSRTDCSTPGLPVHHYLPEFAQVHVHVELSHWKRPWCCKDWGQKEKRVAENEMRWLDGIPAQWTTRGYSPVKIKDKSSEKRLGILEPGEGERSQLCSSLGTSSGGGRKVQNSRRSDSTKWTDALVSVSGSKGDLCCWWRFCEWLNRQEQKTLSKEIKQQSQ